MAGPKMTPDQLAQLEARAKAAARGPWRTMAAYAACLGSHPLVEPGVMAPHPGPRGSAYETRCVGTHGPPFRNSRGDATLFVEAESERVAIKSQFIAAASPDVVLALVDAANERDLLLSQLSVLRSENDELLWLVGNLNSSRGVRNA